MDKKIMIFSFLTILVVLLTFHLVSDLNKNYNMKIKENGDSLKEILMVVNNQELEIVLENNSCTKELLKKLENGELNINLNDYGNFEKVGELGFELPSSDSYINTSPGDVMLYLGNKITIFYDYNSYTYTRIGKIKNINSTDLKNILGSNKVNITLKLKNN